MTQVSMISRTGSWLTQPCRAPTVLCMTQAGVENVSRETAPGRGWRVDDSTFGARLALIRQRMDWNLQEAALACNVPAASWTNWERKGTDPRALLAVVRQIADRTGCDYLWLLAGPEATAVDAA